MLHWVIIEQNGSKCFLEMPHRLYYEFAVRSFSTFQELTQKLKDIGNSTPQERAMLYERRQAMNNVPIYSALSLEAFINYYAIRYEIPFHKDTDRLSTVKKWNIYTNWKNKRDFGSDALSKIKEIFKIRNALVHAKPEVGEMGTNEPPEGKSAQAKIELAGKGELIIDLNSIYQAMFDIDIDEAKQYEQEPWLYTLQKIS